jgi:sialidase-1
MKPPTRRSALMLAFGSPLLARKAPALSRVDLFRQGDGGVHTYRIPSLIETRSGTLLAVVDARHDSPTDLPARISLAMRTSRDRGKTWSEAAFIRRVPEGGVGDPSLLLDRRSGRVWCFHAYGPPGIGFDTAKAGALTGAGTLQVHAMFTDNDGAAWSEPLDMTPRLKDPAWQAMFATSGTNIQSGAGRYLIPVVVRDAQGVVSSRNAYSDDAGKTWRVGAAIAPETDESHCVELAGGTIMQNMRNGKSRAVALSNDGGVTFGAVTHDEALVDPGCNAGITRYRRGHRDLLIFTNAANVRRRNLSVKLSADRGKTWTPGRTIHSGPAAYSTVIVLRDGSIAVLYERGDSFPAERITFARFNLDWAASNGGDAGA